MGFECVALTWCTYKMEWDSQFVANRDRLVADGWYMSHRASFEPKRPGGACIMRRPKDEPRKLQQPQYIVCYPCDLKRCTAILDATELANQPRMWTEGEIKAIFAGWEKTTSRSQELQNRNEKLQAAIDVVVTASGDGYDEDSIATIMAVKKCLWPLVAKEETNAIS